MIPTKMLILCGAFGLFLAACQPESANRALDLGKGADISTSQIEAWTDCLEQDACRTRTVALSGLARHELSTLERGQCSLGADNRPARLEASVAPETQNIVLGGDTPIVLSSGTLLEAPSEFRCDYDEISDVFAEAYRKLTEASDRGDLDAAAMLGSIHLSDPDLYDPGLARSVLEPCDDYGGAECAFHLARIESLQAADRCGDCLIYLRRADGRSRDPGIRFSYALAKRRLDRGAINGPEFYTLSADGGSQGYIMEFDRAFPRIR